MAKTRSQTQRENQPCSMVSRQSTKKLSKNLKITKSKPNDFKIPHDFKNVAFV